MSGIQTVVLCGGRGTRLREYTEAIPKVMVEVGGRPILWHVMKGYSVRGFADFVLALGYLGDRIKEYFVEHEAWRGHDLRLTTGSAEPPTPLNRSSNDRWTVTMVDTGLDTNTGGRIKLLEPHIRGDVFFATYGDGVSDLDAKALLEFHRSHGRIATITVVRPRLNFGVVELEPDGRVRCFREKPRSESWVNGGFFVFDRRVFDYLDGDPVLEREPLERLAVAGELLAWRHDGYWACMDTYKDNVDLNAAWASGTPAWKTWT